MKTTLAILTALIFAGCASEDPNIVNPPPGNANVIVRLFNMVPDDKSRQMLMELGYQSQIVPPGMFSSTVEAPGDSSTIEIFAGQTLEYRSPSRVKFIRQSVYNIYAVASNDIDKEFDTIVVSNANRSLTTLPVAQVRVVNLIPDTSTTFDVRVGCPNGTRLTAAPTIFKEASLYAELPPGVNVLSITKVSGLESELVGTFQCTLEEFTPYSIMLYRTAASDEPQISLIKESDFTTDAGRPFLPVQNRDADIRVCNLAGSTVTVEMTRTGQIISQNQQSDALSAYEIVPTCEQVAPDVIEATFGDGSTATDSSSLTVRGRYTVVTAKDTAAQSALIIVPPAEPVFGRGSRALVRVVNASTHAGGLAVSVSARTDPTDPNNVSSGQSLASSIKFDEVSDPILIEPGEVPLTVFTALNPTTLLSVRRVELMPDNNYLLLMSDDGEGGIRQFLLNEDDQPGVLAETDPAVFFRFLNGSPFSQNVRVTLGSVVSNAQTFYRNTLSTCTRVGGVDVTVDGSVNTITTSDGLRTLAVYAIHNGNETLINISDPPLLQEPGLSQRRVINGCADIEFVSVAYDTTYRSNPETPHVARDVEFGTTSKIHSLTQERRGTMYVYNSQTFEEIFTLPIDLGPLGNSYSLIIVGSKDHGYETIVLQEF